MPCAYQLESRTELSETNQFKVRAIVSCNPDEVEHVTWHPRATWPPLAQLGHTQVKE